MSLPIPKSGNILFVGDFPEGLGILKEIFSRQGHRVRTAACGEHPSQIILEDLPDLVIIDLHVGGMDGFEVWRRQKENSAYRDVPVILVRGLVGTEEEPRAFRLGCVDSIQRPFEADEVLSRVETHLTLAFQRKKLEQAAAKQERRVKKITAQFGRLNDLLRKEVQERKRVEETLRRLIGFDGIMTRVLSEFAACAPHDVDARVLNGLESIAQFIGADQAYVIMISPDRTTWSVTHEWHASHVAPVIHKYQRVPMGTASWSEKMILAGEIIVINSLDDYPPEAVRERMYQQEDGAVSVLEQPIRNAAGQIVGCIGVRAHLQPVSWSDDDVLRMRMIGDTTASLLERKRVEMALRDREERFRLSLDGSDVGSWDWDIPSGEVVYFRHWAEMLGYAAEEVDNSVRSWEGLLHPDDKERVKGAIEDHLAGKTSLYEMEQRVLSKLDEWRWLLFRGRVIKRGEEGKPLRAVGVHVDVTKRKEAEERLRESEENLRVAEEKYRSIFENAPEGIYQSSPDGRSLVVNPALARILGYDSPDEVLATITDWARQVWVDPILRAAYVGDLEENRVVREFECQFFRKDKTKIWVSLNSRAVRGPDGRMLYLEGFIKDITDQKRIEEELHQRLQEIEALKDRLEAESAYLQQEIKLEHNFENIIGKSDALKYVLYRVQQVASTDMTVLILGETGTGKELIARAIHENSSRRARPMVKVNCAVLPANLIESDLFGHEKGAFTGAAARKLGRFELANTATLFLDEIGELPLDLQAKLLRVIEDGEFERLGGTQTIKVNVRIIAATNRNLEKEMKEGRFRSDLWYRLNVYPITVPTLRERTEDIPLMVAHFIELYGKQFGKNIRKIPVKLIETLMSYHWPGNIRELKHVIERAVLSSWETTLQLADNLSSSAASPSHAVAKTLDEMERQYVLEILEKTGWKVEGKSGAAEILNINPGTLRSRMRKLGIRKNHSYYAPQ